MQINEIIRELGLDIASLVEVGAIITCPPDRVRAPTALRRWSSARPQARRGPIYRAPRHERSDVPVSPSARFIGQSALSRPKARA